ncbi:unnamed protein product [Moneuplotes crassus]|uniref:Uncharacterized protein n=1 Tax=Euplotes crassus TaxID=5936 RepID=A0AAD1XNJ9_EUPCR|nr:unnamed protein product [Moneuplotes crassus]
MNNTKSGDKACLIYIKLRFCYYPENYGFNTCSASKKSLLIHTAELLIISSARSCELSIFSATKNAKLSKNKFRLEEIPNPDLNSPPSC